jgi:sugar transferase (PEP-CTERM/EpsH1 system associated)
MEAPRQRILVVTPSLPYPPNWGFGIRVYQLVRHLAQRHHVSLLTFGTAAESDKVAALRAVCDEVHVVEPRVANRRQKRWTQLRSVFAATSFQTMALRSPAMQRTIDELLATQSFNLVQLESSQLSSYDFGQVPVIVDEHNVEYELLQRMYRTERSPLRRLYNWLEYVKFRREERACWRRVDAAIFTSAREAEIFRRFAPDTPSIVAANGVDVDFFQPNPSVQIDRDSVVFTGLISYRPNTDAVLYFAREVLPLIVAQRPNVRFTVVGMGPTDEIKSLAGKNVVVTDAVPDVRPYLAAAGAVVVPLRMGSGTRLKVLEALAMAKPVVSTAVGCEGIDVADDEHLLVEDDPAAFVTAVLRLLDDAALAARLGQAGRELAEARYSWRSVADDVDALYRRLAHHAEAAPAGEAAGEPAMSELAGAPAAA